jgi:pyruvate formate lyase activating enzyme
MKTFAEYLDEMTTPGELFDVLGEDKVRCFACAHRCTLKPGQRGICKMRFNRDGVLQVPKGYVAALQADPIEKKPLFHVLSGSDALTFGMLGCNFHCDFCQNWVTSQTLRDPQASARSQYSVREITAEEVIGFAIETGAEAVVSSYNEPLITTEWAVEIFKLAKAVGLKTAYISNGFATPEVLEYLKPYLDAYKIDLKSMQPENYRDCGGNLEAVLQTIRRAREMGFWVEVVTLVIPGYNDSAEELWKASRFIREVSADIPWHVTAFHPDYRMQGRDWTPASSLQLAADVGQEAGLKYVYAGNLPGRVGSLENTYCPECQTLLVKRKGFTITEYRVTGEGRCLKCGAVMAGIWTEDPESVQIGGIGMPRSVWWD